MTPFLMLAESPPMDGTALIVAAVLAMITMSFLTSRGQKKEKDKHAKWVDGLAKNTHVVTRSGIHGSVMNVRPDGVVLKVDEEKGVKMTFSRDAISHQVEPTSTGS